MGHARLINLEPGQWANLAALDAAMLPVRDRAWTQDARGMDGRTGRSFFVEVATMVGYAGEAYGPKCFPRCYDLFRRPIHWKIGYGWL